MKYEPLEHTEYWGNKLKLPNKFGNLERFTDENGGRNFNFKKGWCKVIDHMIGGEFIIGEIKKVPKEIAKYYTDGNFYRYPTLEELKSIL